VKDQQVRRDGAAKGSSRMISGTQINPHDRHRPCPIQLQVLIRSYPQVLPDESISPKSRLTSDLTAASLGVVTVTHK
jgi:hypothetical protein